jgi:hypothetical protein
MARPKTQAATYERFSLRLPPELLARVRALTSMSGAPVNTALVRLLELGVEAQERESTYDRTHMLMPCREG